MKNILMIVANPKPKSLSFAIADRYKIQAVEKGHSVETIDLYSDPHQQPFFTYENYPNAIVTPEMKYYHKKISKADELVIVFPYWWGSMPAILKNFIDWNFSAGFAYQYVNSRPTGLLKGKNVKIFTTTGAPWFLYLITGAHRRLRNMWKNEIIEFCGMKIDTFNIFGGVDTSGKNSHRILDKIKA